MLLVELYKLNISIRAIPIYNKQLVAIPYTDNYIFRAIAYTQLARNTNLKQ
jgi:hypothetical protein